MKGRAAAVRVILVAGIAGLGYLFARDMPLDHGFVYILLLAGFILCDRSFLPRRFR